jgi:hypothetical protein
LRSFCLDAAQCDVLRRIFTHDRARQAGAKAARKEAGFPVRLPQYSGLIGFSPLQPNLESCRVVVGEQALLSWAVQPLHPID